MKAVVMAGGEGTRLRPLTSHRPKPLSPVLNKPIMEHIIELLKRHGITEIVVTLHYLADEIEGYFGDGSEWGVKLHYSVEDIPLGTAGSVKQAEHLLKDDTFVIVSGDALTDIDLKRAIDYHQSKKSIATLVLSHVPNPLDFGVVITDDEGRIRRFLEKPSWGEVFSDTVNTGMYILEPSVFDYMEPQKNYDWSQHIFPQILQDEKALYGYIMPGYWCDIGNLNQYRESQYTVLDGATKVTIPGAHANGNYIGKNCEIAADAVINAPTLIGDNVKIKSGATVGPYAVIGYNAIVEEGAVIHRSVLWDNVYVGANTRLTACTVCNQVIIQRDCNIQEGAVVGERCRIERESTIRTQIKLWPDKVIEAGSTVTMSLIWGQKWLGALFRNEGVTGIANIEITPELATKLGSTYGAYLKRGSTVMTGRDSGRAARMIKRAVIAGLLSVGCDVVDLRSMPLPIMRRMLRGSGAAGGIYVRIAPQNPRLLLIEFLDQDGVYLSKAAERKVETIYYREDFARVDSEQIGSLEFASRSVESYQRDFAEHLDTEAIAERKFRVVVDFAYGRVASVFPDALGRLGCDFMALNSYVDPAKAPKTREERAALLPNLSHIVRTLSADMGVLLENDGERMILVDETGRIIQGDDLLVLLSVMVARTHPGARIAVPVNAPSCIEPLVVAEGAEYIQTKTDVRSLGAAASGAHAATFAGDDAGGFIFSQFMPAFDCMYSFGKVLEMAAKLGGKLGDIAALMPATPVVHELVRCPWEMKGRIMRELTREAEATGGASLIDGVKVVRDEGWTLVLPDASEPYFHVYAEGKTEADSQRMVSEYVQTVERLKGD